MKELTNSEKASANRQIELLSDAFNTALNAGGYWLNATGKKYPKFYPQGVAVNPHNALLMALHSDKNGCKSNLFTLYNEAKARGASVSLCLHSTFYRVGTDFNFRSLTHICYFLCVLC